MFVYDVDLQSIKFYSCGIKISAADLSSYDKSKQLVIYSAGCAVNLTLTCVFASIDKYNAALTNLALCLFNLLPLPQLDGGRILHLFLENNPLERVSNIIAYAVQSVFALIILAYSFMTYDYKSVVMFAFLLLCSAFE